jgi:hypothetical protein
LLDPDIRHPLARILRPEHGSGHVLCEVGLWGNSVRIDLARLTDLRLEGFEIKSDGDTLARLRNQADIYNLIFDTVTLVAARKHLEKANQLLPMWWGLIEAVPGDGGVTFNTIRPASDNPTASPERIAGLLWKDEALAALRALGDPRGLSRLRLAEMHATLAQSMSISEIRTLVFRAIAARRDWMDRHDPFFVGPPRPRTGML